jgi:hypothetical protein
MDQDLNSEPPGYESGALLTPSRRSTAGHSGSLSVELFFCPARVGLKPVPIHLPVWFVLKGKSVITHFIKAG